MPTKEIKEFRKTWFSIIYNLVLFVLLFLIPTSLIGCIWGGFWLHMKILATDLVAIGTLWIIEETL